MTEETTDDALRAWLTLSTVPGLELGAAVALLQEFGSADSVLSAGREALKRIAGSAAGNEIADGPDEERSALIEQNIAWVKNTPGAFAVALDDPDYPAGLFETGCTPLVLFGIGKRKLLGSRFIAVFGSQHPTSEGLKTAFEFGAGMRKAGLTLLSAMMNGIEAESLKGALTGQDGAAAVFCAAPLNRVYPPGARDLMRETAARGVLLSALPIGTPFSEEALENRYRLMAGMASAVLLLEAGRTSRAIPVMKMAGALGRDMLAVPGSIRLPLSKGPNRMIREGARLVESVKDIAAETHGLSEDIPDVRDDAA